MSVLPSKTRTSGPRASVSRTHAPPPRPLAALVVLALASSSWISACAEPTGGSADLVVTNATVVTVDPALPQAEAIAVRGSEIVAVGTIASIDEWIGAGTEVVDAGGRLVIPGFIESHGHFMGLGRAKMILDLTTATTWSEIVAMVADAAAEAEPGAWINGRGWHQEKWTVAPDPVVEGNPVHDALSAASPNNPVNLGHASGHASFANAMAMELAGIVDGTPDPDGGTIVRDAQGAATGLMRETAQRMIGAAQSDSESGRSEAELRAESREMVRLAGEEALSKGVTSFHDAGASFATIDFLRELDEAGDLPIRLNVMVRRESNEDMAEHLADYKIVAEGNGHLTVRSIKRQIDGALGSHGAWLLEPYEDLASSTGLVLEPVEDVRRTAEIAVENGFQVNTHAIGDRANREVLDIYESVFAEKGVQDPGGLRWRIEHAQHLHPDDIQRFADMGIIAAMQGIHGPSDGPWVLARLGEDRAESGAYLWRSLIDAGVVISNGTDVPVEDIDPIASLYASVSRVMTTGERFHPEQSMTRMEALRSYTINGAFAEFAEDRKGSISEGKLADIVILSDNILEVPEESIPDAKVDLTIVGGEIRYRRPGA